VFLPRAVPALDLSPRAPTPVAVQQRPIISFQPLVPSSHADWSEWRGNPQHTGFQSVPGKVAAPAIQWRFRLGGRIEPWQAVLCGVPGLDASLLVSPAGRLASYSLDGDLLWERRETESLSLLGCWDFAGDGRTEILAGSSGQSGGQLYLLNAQDGDLLWTSPAGPGAVGAVKVVHLVPLPGLQILWLPAASSRITAFALEPGARVPRVLWANDLPDFVSDPYTYSSLAFGDLENDGSQRIVISGGRHSIPTIVLDATTGWELYRRTITLDGHGVESGGPSQLLRLNDVGDGGKREILTVSSYGSGEAYMFQGITVTSLTDPFRDSVLDTYPVGLHYVRGSVQDIDGDGRLEITVSRYFPDQGRNDLMVLDAASLQVKAAVPDFFLRAIVPAPGIPGRLILGSRGVTGETLSGEEPLKALEYAGGKLQETGWDPGLGLIADPLPRAFDIADEDNPGESAAVLDFAGSGRDAILLYDDRNQDNQPDEIVASDVESGAVLERWGIDPGVPIKLLAVQNAPDPARSRFVIGGSDGSLTFLDGGFRVVRSVPIGGYCRSDALNGHAFEVAAVADLDGKGRKDILALDSLSRVVKLTGVAGATPEREPRSAVLWDSGTDQELLAVPSSQGGARLLVRGWSDGVPVLRMIDGSGNMVWEHDFAPPYDIPVGLNWGHFRGGSPADVVASVDSAGGPRRTVVLDGDTGQTVWASDVGTYWDGSFAVADVNQDGRDDLVFNYNAWKGFVLDGASGRPLVDPVVLPSYNNLESVDYNGAPIALGSMGGRSFLFLDSGDDAHLALLSADSKPGDTDPVAAGNPWSLEQAAPDDERYSMAAVAPLGSEDFVIGAGSQRGNLKAVRGSDGTVLWEIGLWNGSAGPVSDSRTNSLSSVLAVDVNGDGRPNFVVGGADGWLYAVDAASGALLWSFDLGAPVGEPIAADIDGDGASELLVPAADGYLYAIGPRS
jgi:outer membrane protein assembly factor BamB